MKFPSVPCRFWLVILILTGCTPHKPLPDPPRVPPENAETDAPRAASIPRWFSFNRGDFCEIPAPSLAPAIDFVPWTEAVRVDSAVLAADSVTGYFLVNRLGLLAFSDGIPRLYRDGLFALATAANLMLLDQAPVIHFYRGDFFAAPPDSIDIPVMVRVQGETMTPILTKNGLGIPGDAQVTDVVYDGEVWRCSIKQNIGQRVAATYRRFRLPGSAIPGTGGGNGERPQYPVLISAGEFRTARSAAPWTDAPDRLHSLLSGLGGKGFEVRCLTPGSTTTTLYRHDTSDDDAPGLSAAAILASGLALALFSDGTLFIQTGQSPKAAFTLPPLPPGFQYGRCVVSGGTLFAAWEETDFYQTGRAGFIAVNLGALP
ncbi:MAG: hypothetical protein LBS64_00610 [Spirochaetaceae bacterium]|jgi:hypothetical protein|nr:hypothetical protein [Spirochaetaceae bacterium]